MKSTAGKLHTRFNRFAGYLAACCATLHLGCASTQTSTATPTTIDALQQISNWERVGAGVWSTTIGEMDGELRYTELAAERPRLEALKRLGEAEFPFDPDEIRYEILPDGRLMVRIPLAPDEKIYGFGLQLDRLDHTQRVMTLKVDHWSQGGGETHAPVPFYVSSKGYGVFFDTARYLKVYAATGNRKDATQREPEFDRNPVNEEERGKWNAQPRGDAVEVSLLSPGLEVVIFAGETPLEVVQRYNLYSGGGTLPPLWGLGFWHRMHAHADAEDVYAELAEFKEQGIPLDVLGLEPGWMTRSYPCTFEWQTLRFPDPKGFTQSLLDDGIHLNLWINPYISQKGSLHEPLYPLSGSHTVWHGIVPDFQVPEARAIFTDHFREEHFGFGVSGYKADEVDGYDRWLWPDHATFPSGTSAEAMRQTYGMQLQKALYTDLFRSENRRSYNLVRATSGAASAYPFVLYSDSYDHEEYITGISAASLGGILWTPEIRRAGNAREWLNRMQTVCFSHMAMLNAWVSGAKPWSFPEVTDSVREVIELRMRLLPYFYTAFADYHFEGIPPIRAMVLEDGDFRIRAEVEAGELDGETNPYEVDRVFEKNDQFMFGPDMLVAPFYGPRYATAREVALPTGDWYDFHSGAFVGNGEIIEVDAETLGDRIPLFVRGGATIPMLKDAANNAKAVSGASLVLRHYGEGEGFVRIYEDDATTFDYLSGEYRFREVRIREDGSFEETIQGAGPALYGDIEAVEKMTRGQR